MKHNKKSLKIALPVAACLTATGLLCYFIVILFNCFGFFEERAAELAWSYTQRVTLSVSDGVDADYGEIKSTTVQVDGVNDDEALRQIGKAAAEAGKMKCLQFMLGTDALYRFGENVGSATNALLEKLTTSGSSVSDVFMDQSLGELCVAVYEPVRNSSLIDGAIAYYTVGGLLPQAQLLAEKLSSEAGMEGEQYGVSLSCCALADGSIMDLYAAEDFPEDKTHNLYTYIYNITESKETAEAIERSGKAKESGSFEITAAGNKYVVSFARLENVGDGVMLCSVFKLDDLITRTYTVFNRVFGCTAAVAVTAILSLVLFILAKHKSYTQDLMINDYDSILGCNSYNRFVYEASDILSVNKISRYALIYLAINNFEYIKESFDSQTAEELTQHISTVVMKMTGANETYGHVMDDKFVMLLHYTNVAELEDRIKICDALVATAEPFRNSSYTVKMLTGIYIVERDRNDSVPEMVDKAKISQQACKQQTNTNYVFYSESMRNDFMREAEIESKMEHALKAKEFCVFYQPKYNINHDRIDGAEALVRWYDPASKSYILPDEFVHLFEVNGFVSKLDRYVFTEVCRFLNESSERSVPKVPVSINISRVTAIQPDFLNFYINTKREYNIPNELLTLEFTESFAFENYETLDKIVRTLKSNGFYTSVDDFGSGYSSFLTLKELKMDELKLDKLFLKHGEDRQKDEMLIQTMVALGKSFGMKVTQEGTETLEEMKMLQRFGCDVVQGYYYSKPLSKSDFIQFITSDTSLRGISENSDKGKFGIVV